METTPVPPDPALLERYLAGECTPGEAAAFRAWIDADPTRRATALGLQQLAALPGDHHASFDVDGLWGRVATRLALQGDSVVPPSGTRPAPSAAPVSPVLNSPAPRWHRGARPAAPRPVLHGWRAASLAVITVICLLVAGLSLRARRADNPVARALTTYVTAAGERATIELTDGTTVTLNVASRLEIPKDFGPDNRAVRLSGGEAYFRVPHTTGAPFVVEAAGVHVKVLGTAFGVRAYQPSDVRVAVHSGRVAVDTVVLGAHDVARTGPGGRLIVARGQNLDAALGFVRGELVLPDVALRDAVVDLNRWYAVDIRLGDPALGDLPMDARLFSGSIGDLMETLRKTFDVRIVRDGRTLTLYPR